MENSEKKEKIEKIDKKNLAYKTYRFFTTVPKNVILIRENTLTKNATVVHWGAYFSLPITKTVGLSLDARTYDFPPQVFQTGASQKRENNDEDAHKEENFDIEVDAAITYRIKGGDKPPKAVVNENENSKIIRAKNKALRRQWQKEHGALKVFFDLNNDRSRIEKQLQTVVYDALRRYVSNNTYETILAKHIDENSELYQEINDQLGVFGLEVVNFNIQNVNQIKEINEAESKAKALELESKAQADAVKREAIAKADAYRLQGQAEAEIIKQKGLAEAEAAGAVARAKVDAFEGKSYSEIAAMNEKEFKNINLNLQTSNNSTTIDNTKIMTEINGLKQMLDNLQAATVKQQDEVQEQRNEATAAWDFDDVEPEPVVESSKMETTTVEETIVDVSEQHTVPKMEEKGFEEIIEQPIGLPMYESDVVEKDDEVVLAEQSTIYNALQGAYSTDVTEEIINQITEDDENVVEEASKVKSIGSLDIMPGIFNRK